MSFQLLNNIPRYKTKAVSYEPLHCKPYFLTSQYRFDLRKMISPDNVLSSSFLLVRSAWTFDTLIQKAEGCYRK